MKRVNKSRSTTIEFEGERYALLPPDTPVPDEGVAAHYQVITPTGEAVYESCDAAEAAKTALLFAYLFDHVLLNIRRDQTWWRLVSAGDEAQTAFVIRAAERGECRQNCE